MRKPLVVLAAILLAAFAAFGLVAVPASAHSKLEASDPAEGAVLDAAPDRIVLEFNQNVELRRDDTRLITASGSDIPIGDVLVEGRRITLRIDGDLGVGAHALQWSVASADGHPISGVLRFTTLAGLPTTVPPTTVAPAPTGDPDAPVSNTPDGDAPVVDGPGDGSALPEPTEPNAGEELESGGVAAPSDGDDEGGSAMPWLIGAVVVVAIAAAVGVIARGGASGGTDDPTV